MTRRFYFPALLVCFCGAFAIRHAMFAGQFDPYSPAHSLDVFIQFSIQLSGLQRFCLELFSPIGMVIVFAVGIYMVTYCMQKLLCRNSASMKQAMDDIRALDNADVFEKWDIYKKHNVSIALPLLIPILRIACVIFIMLFFIRGILLPDSAVAPFYYTNLPCAMMFLYRFITMESAQQLALAGVINILLIVLALLVFTPPAALFICIISLLFVLQEHFTSKGTTYEATSKNSTH